MEVMIDEEVDLSNETLASLMGMLSKNYKAQQPFKDKLGPLEKEATNIKKYLLPKLMEQGLKKTSTKTESVTIQEIEAVKVDDMDKFLRAVKREHLEHILSVKTTEAKEYRILKGKEIPGTHTEVTSRFIRISAMKK